MPPPYTPIPGDPEWCEAAVDKRLSFVSTYRHSVPMHKREQRPFTCTYCGQYVGPSQRFGGFKTLYPFVIIEDPW